MPKKPYYEDAEPFNNSEDEYVSESDDQSAGDSADADVTDVENSTIDIDPDDEKEFDANDDDKFDPVNETEEVEDPDAEADGETEGEGEADADAEGEIEEGDADAEGEAAEGDDDRFPVQPKVCHLKNLNKDFMVLDEDDSNMYGKMEYKRVTDADRETDPIMTHYEMVRIIGVRAQQFNFGAEPLVKGLEGMHPAKMATVELLSKMTPFIIRRRLPGKKYEEWKVHELEMIHEITDDFFIPENFDWNSLMKLQPTEDAIKQLDKQPAKETTKEPTKETRNKQERVSGSKGSKGSKRPTSKKTNSKRSIPKKTNSKNVTPKKPLPKKAPRKKPTAKKSNSKK